MKKENGAIVVEATISLTAFMFAILTVMETISGVKEDYSSRIFGRKCKSFFGKVTY